MLWCYGVVVLCCCGVYSGVGNLGAQGVNVWGCYVPCIFKGTSCRYILLPMSAIICDIYTSMKFKPLPLHRLRAQPPSAHPSPAHRLINSSKAASPSTSLPKPCSIKLEKPSKKEHEEITSPQGCQSKRGSRREVPPIRQPTCGTGTKDHPACMFPTGRCDGTAAEDIVWLSRAGES